jgi:hypothetical protein
MSLPQLLTADEIATFIRRRPWQVYDLARRNILPSVRVGNRVMFSQEAIERWVAEGGRGLDAEGVLRRGVVPAAPARARGRRLAQHRG